MNRKQKYNLASLKDDYRLETNKSPYATKEEKSNYSNEYVKWLELRNINHKNK